MSTVSIATAVNAKYTIVDSIVTAWYTAAYVCQCLVNNENCHCYVHTSQCFVYNCKKLSMLSILYVTA